MLVTIVSIIIRVLGIVAVNLAEKIRRGNSRNDLNHPNDSISKICNQIEVNAGNLSPDLLLKITSKNAKLAAEINVSVFSSKKELLF